ncbi:hypothetical protein RclHR1_04110008 [Rhizophagus clarus]|uniref:Distal membrane-arm assembly complex protein 1-like domain-containing protein n=1 Tax=Rhizophagus clarus TaxID=94130 RepID=A0A2Z6RF29_9GLOM|nr:hypothetical protein RclHR1_04110008 [Rhizophagus clarus]GES84408.1 hypothetical protein RCL_jg22772.t1 [Rhizophagus clarus]
MSSEKNSSVFTNDKDNKDETLLQSQRKEYKDCLSCRVIGVATFWGLGTYTIYQSFVHKPKLSRGFRFGLVLVGIGFMQVGVFRLLN